MSARDVPWSCASTCLSIIRRIALIVRMQDAVLADEGRAVRQVKYPESSGSLGYMINGNSTDSGLFEPESVKNYSRSSMRELIYRIMGCESA